MSELDKVPQPIVRGPFKDRIGTATRFDVYTVEWQSGLRAILQECDRPFLVGQAHMFFDPFQESALEYAHVLEHLKVFGSASHSRISMLKMMDGNSSVGAYCTDNTIEFGLEVLPNNWQILIPALARFVKNNHFTELALRQEISVLISELAPSLADITEQSKINAVRRLWPKTKYSYLLNESEARYRAVTLDRIREFRENLVLANRVVLGVTGSFDVQRIIDKIGSQLSSLQYKELHDLKIELPNPKNGIVRIRKRTGNFCAVTMIHPICLETKEDVQNISWYGTLLCSILSEAWNSSLIIKSRKLGIHNSQVWWDSVGNVSYMGITFASSPESIGKFLYYYITTINKMRRNGPTDEQVRIAKNLWILDTLRNSENLRRRTYESCRSLYSSSFSPYVDYRSTLAKINSRSVRSWTKRALNVESGALLVLYGNNDKVLLSPTVEKFCS